MEAARGITKVPEEARVRQMYYTSSPFYLNHSIPCGYMAHPEDNEAYREVMSVRYVPHLGSFFFKLSIFCLLAIFLCEVKDSDFLTDVLGNMTDEHADAEGYLPMTMRVHQLMKVENLSNVW